MRNKEYPYTSPLPLFYVVGVVLLMGGVLLNASCSRQVTPQEQREQVPRFVKLDTIRPASEVVRDLT